MKKDKSETKERIFKAVNDLYKAEGTEALTLSNIAKKAGISKGGLLYHFPTKDAILVGLIERNMKEFVEGADELISEIKHIEGDALGQRLEYFVDCYVEEYLEDLEPGILGILAQRPDFAKMTRETDEKVFKIFMEYFDDKEEVVLLLIAIQGFFLVKVAEYDFLVDGFEEKVKQMITERLKKRIKRS